MYDELWVGGKCMYKLEPIVADMDTGDAYEEGRYVANQWPSPTTQVDRGTTIKLYFKTARDFPSAPDVVGLSYGEAERRLAQAGLKVSTDMGWFSSWSKLCERELGQIKPEDFPTASELRGDAGGAIAPVTDVEPAVLKVE